MKGSKGLLGLFLFIADLLFIGIVVVYYCGIAGPSGHTIDPSFLAGVRASAILGAMCEAIPYLLVISVIITVIYCKGFMKGEVSAATRYCGTAFLIVSLIICLVLPMSYYTGDVSVRTAAADGKFKDTNASVLRIVLNIVSSAGRRRHRIRNYMPYKITTDSYYIKFDGNKCPASITEYNDYREGKEYYIVSFGLEDYECFNTEEYMLP